MKRFIWTIALVAIGAAAGWLGALAAEKPDPLPDAIARIVQRMFPDAEVQHSERDKHDDEYEYDITLRTRPDNRVVRMKIRTDVGVTEIDETVKADDLPTRVRRSLDSSLPGGTITGARKKSEIRIRYHVDVTVSGKRREVTLSAKGKILEIDKKD